MRSVLCSALFCLLLAPGLSVQAQATLSYAKKVSIQTDSKAGDFVDSFMNGTATEAHVPGALVAVVENGKIVYLAAYGEADVEQGRPVDPQKTLFRIGSVSKNFVILGILKLWQDGRLSLDDTVEKYLPELSAKFEHPVTIQQLATHTGGFDERLVGLAAAPEETLPDLSTIALDQYPGQIAPPGSYYNYSNYGYLVLAAILEKASGSDFISYEKSLMSEMGLSGSSFQLSDLESAQLARSYVFGPDGGRVLMPTMRLRYYPVGSVYATATDMGRYLEELCNGLGRAGLQRQTYSRLIKTAYRPDPEVPGSALGFYERDLRGLRMLEHGGDWEGFSTLVSFSPETRSGIFISTNGTSDPLLREKFMQSYADFLGLSKVAEPSSAKPAHSLDQYTGHFRYARYEHNGPLKMGGLPLQVDVSVDGDGLLATFPAEQSKPIHLIPVGGDRFHALDPSVTVVFQFDGDSVRGISGTYLVPFYLERISAFEGMGVVIPLAAFSVLSFLSCLFLPVARRIAYKIRGREEELLNLPEDERKTFRLLIATAWAHVLFLIGTQLHMGILQQHIIEGIPRSMEALLYLPYGLLALTVVLALRIPRMFNSFGWGTPLKVYYSIVVIAGVVFFQLLWYWNIVAPVRG
ncbi:MAG: serine hydrolase [Leptospiraceae bacterium]|nr:serine hydrolase [Leptospiraceae bacterium]